MMLTKPPCDTQNPPREREREGEREREREREIRLVVTRKILTYEV
jgi:hypothetical protein